MFRKLRRDERGAALVEFGLLVPIILGTFMGVMQVGLGMQQYNALRSVSADTARYAMVEYQKENAPTTTSLETQARTIATTSPYVLDTNRFTVSVTPVATPRVTGALEFTITVGYTVPTVLSFLGVANIPLSYSRPIFVVDNS